MQRHGRGTWRPGFAAVGLAVLLVARPGAASGGLGAQQTDSLEGVAERAIRAVVLLDVETGSDSRQGSGFVVDSSGRILTNEHVVRDARRIRVKLASGDMYDAVDVLAADDRRDIAVLRIAGFNLPALPLGDSDSVRVGAPVVLIGSPLGLENTVSTGIVSARRREGAGYELLQISAPASRGSSGGPVLAQSGEVVGIASSQMQTGQNLNFAIPINYARGLLNHLEDEPLVMLRPDRAPAEEPPGPLPAREMAANMGLYFDLRGFDGHAFELQTRSGDDRVRRTRITYRMLETVGREGARLERYMESETTRRTEPFGTRQTVRRERARTLVGADGLTPLSTGGEIAWWTGSGWTTASYDLRFEPGRVRGLVTDSTGRVEELDREVPSGMLPREMADLAFASLAADSLVGRSIELTTFDPWAGTVVRDRYDILETTEVRVAGREHDALRVNVASGLANATAWFALDRRGLLLRRIYDDGNRVEELVDPEGG